MNSGITPRFKISFLWAYFSPSVKGPVVLLLRGDFEPSVEASRGCLPVVFSGNAGCVILPWRSSNVFPSLPVAIVGLFSSLILVGVSLMISAVSGCTSRSSASFWTSEYPLLFSTLTTVRYNSKPEAGRNSSIRAVAKAPMKDLS